MSMNATSAARLIGVAGAGAVLGVGLWAVLEALLIGGSAPAEARTGTRAAAGRDPRVGALDRRLEALESRLEIALGGPARESVTDLETLIEEAVKRWMREHAALTAGAAPEELPSSDRLARLLDPSLGAEERLALLQELRDEGRLDEVVAALEEALKNDPGNPEAHFLLGQAYVEQILAGAQGEAAAELAALADAAYDDALAIDPYHWDARYAKALGLTYWPEHMGKQGEAIDQFQELIDQQASGPKKPAHAKAHLLLGNMYMKMGNLEAAAEAWKVGLSLFPDHEGLQSQLAAVED